MRIFLVHDNALTSLPDELFTLPLLGRVSVSGNPFPPGPLDARWFQLSSLVDLHVGCTSITSLPSEIYTLQALNAGFNNFTTLPPPPPDADAINIYALWLHSTPSLTREGLEPLFSAPLNETDMDLTLLPIFYDDDAVAVKADIEANTILGCTITDTPEYLVARGISGSSMLDYCDGPTVKDSDVRTAVDALISSWDAATCPYLWEYIPGLIE